MLKNITFWIQEIKWKVFWWKFWKLKSNIWKNLDKLKSYTLTSNSTLKLHFKPQKCSWKNYWKTTALSLKESRIFCKVLAFYSLIITPFIPYVSPGFALSYSNAIIILESNKTECGRYWEQETKIYHGLLQKTQKLYKINKKWNLKGLWHIHLYIHQGRRSI